MREFVLTLILVASSSSFVFGEAEPPLNDKYHVTQEEKAACSSDAVRLCSEAYPDEDALIACMKVKHAQLNKRCQSVFDTGLRRRRL